MLEFIGAMILLGFMIFLTYLFVKGVPNKIREKDAEYQKERFKTEENTKSEENLADK